MDIRFRLKQRLKSIIFKCLFLSLVKHRTEFQFQKSWVSSYMKSPDKVLEYWRKYRFLNEIEKIVDFKNSVVLDVGCGISTILNYIDAKEKHGIDPLAKEYKRIFKYPKGIKVKQGRGENLPYPENSFDVVICSNALDHTENPQKTLQQIHSVLKPGGNFILTLEIFPETYKRKRDPAHPHNITEGKLKILLRGFTILFHKKSPWIGLKNYVEYGNEYKAERYEHILVCIKKD